MKFKHAVKPVFDELYAKVKSGEETARVLDVTSRPAHKKSGMPSINFLICIILSLVLV